jgi:hypothetical protein
VLTIVYREVNKIHIRNAISNLKYSMPLIVPERKERERRRRCRMHSHDGNTETHSKDQPKLEQMPSPVGMEKSVSSCMWSDREPKATAEGAAPA